MSTHQSVKRDERTVAVENASYKWGLIFITFALLIDVVYRGAVRNEAAWDLMALVIGSSAIGTVYQVRQKTLPKAVLVAIVVGAVAAVIAVSFTK
jgi:hypothetical protein